MPESIKWTEDDLKAVIILKKKALALMRFTCAAELRSLEKDITKALHNDWTDSIINDAADGKEKTV